MTISEIDSRKTGIPLNYREAIHSIPLGERLQRVEEIRDTVLFGIPSYSQSVRNELWGLVSVDGLPFIFRAWPNFPQVPRKLPYVSNGGILREYETNWWPHAPYNPLEFRSEIIQDPMILKELAMRLGTSQDNVFAALEERRKGYEVLKRKYNEYSVDGIVLKGAYDAAISIACDQLDLK